MKTQGKFTLVIRGSTDEAFKVPLSSWDGFNYLFQRLVTGQVVAMSEFPYYGMDIQVGPRALLAAAADYLDDGFHETLVADLREIVEGGELEEFPDRSHPR